jgi:hypothetical protein
MEFELFSVGDALFVSRVLNATAMMSNSGVFQALAAIGFLVGLFAVAIKTIQSQKADFSAYAAGFVVYCVLFWPTADVIVVDASPSMGRSGIQNIRVDNVPVGVAGMGWFVSSVSSILREKMLTAFSVPGVTEGMATGDGATTRAIEALAAMRSMSDPQQNTLMTDATSEMTTLMMNLKSFIGRCSELEVSSDTGRLSTLMNSRNPMDPMVGLGSTEEWIGVDQWTYDAGSGRALPTTKSCAQASTDLDNQLQSPATLDLVKASLAPMLKLEGDDFEATWDVAERLLVGAATRGYAGDANLAGSTALSMQRYAVAHVVGGALQKTVASAQANSHTMALNIVLGDAMAQRNTQWVLEESLFLQMARPISAFFESMVYICAPFMAFALGLGSFGLSMALRYTQLTIWVMLWGPTMAAINLFQVTMAEAAFEATARGHGKSGDLGSIAGAVKITEDAESWIAIGSMLMASTPAITLMLLFGSAMTAVGLANRLQSADTINEKNASPDAVSTGAGVAQQSAFMGTNRGGTVASGAPEMSLSMEAARTASRANEAMSADRSSSAFMAQWGSEVGSTIQSTWGRSQDVGSDAGMRSGYTGTAALMQSREFQAATQGMTRAEKVAFAEAVQVAATENKGGVDWGSMAERIAGLAGTAARGPVGAAASVAVSGAHASSGAVSKDESRDGTRGANANFLEAAQRYASVLKNDSGERAEVAAAAGATARDIARQDGTKANSFGERSGFNQSLNNVQEASQAVRSLDQVASSTAMSNRIPLNTAANYVAGSPEAMGMLRKAFDEGGGTQAQWDQITKGEGAKFTELGYSPQQGAAAAVLSHFAGGNAPAGQGEEYFKALTGALKEAGVPGMTNATKAANLPGLDASDPAPNAPNGQDVRALVGANSAEAPTTASDGRAAAGVALGSGSTAAFESWAERNGLGDELALARGGANLARTEAGTDPTNVQGGPALEAARNEGRNAQETEEAAIAGKVAAPLVNAALNSLKPELANVGDTMESRRFAQNGAYEGEVAAQGSGGLDGLAETAASIREQLAVGPGVDDRQLGQIAAAVAFQSLATRGNEQNENGEYTAGKPTAEQVESYNALLAEMSPQSVALANLIGATTKNDEDGAVSMRPEAVALASGRYMSGDALTESFQEAGVQLEVPDVYTNANDGVYQPNQATTQGSRIVPAEDTELTPEQRTRQESLGFNIPQTTPLDPDANPEDDFGDSVK